MTYETTVMRELESGEVEVNIEVEYTAYGASRGSRDSLCGKAGAGAPLEPDEPAHIEIDSVTNRDTGDAIELTHDEENTITTKIEDSLERDYGG